MVRRATVILSLFSMAVLLAAVITGARSMSSGAVAAHAIHLKVALLTVFVGMLVNVLAVMLVIAADKQIHELGSRVDELEAAAAKAAGGEPTATGGGAVGSS